MTGDNDEEMELTLYSFGFKHGVPDDVTVMFDVRFLPNPYWEEDMRHLTGMDREVAEYVLDSREGKRFMEKFLPLLELMIEQNLAAGKTSMRVGIGCTGGQHRSVAVVEQLGRVLNGGDRVRFSLFHRDLALR